MGDQSRTMNQAVNVVEPVKEDFKEPERAVTPAIDAKVADAKE